MSKFASYLLTLIGIVLLQANCCKCDPIIRIGKKHQIIGQSVLFMNTEINEYLGIPYAKPPIGDLRFKKTKPLRPCPEVVNATRLPPACPQYSEDPYPWYVNTSYQSEDCLYLNIWTPADASPENRKAVMYWIHGGAYKYGSISELYSGVPLAAFGNIIVVTVNYRLGPLGFLSLGTKDAPGNAGLWDVLEGLRWVNRNIVYFGGDELRITIAGESVGSSMVGFLAVSPLAKGLFARQIMQSGSPAEPTSTNSTRNILLAQKLAETVGCAGDNSTVQDDPEDVIQCLKDVDSDTLIEASYRLDPLSQLDFVPQQGDKLLPVNPNSAIFEGSFRCRQLLIGITKDEGSRMMTAANPEIFGLFGEKDTKITKTMGKDILRKMFGNLSESVIEHYLPDDVAEDEYDYVRYQVYTSLGDKAIFCPTVYYAEQSANKGCGVYYYAWVHRPSVSPWAPWMGSPHFSEVEFVFGQPLLNPIMYQEMEQELSWLMIKIWSNFVKTGKPAMRWPFYSQENPNFILIGPGDIFGIIETAPHGDNCNFYRQFLEP